MHTDSGSAGGPFEVAGSTHLGRDDGEAQAAWVFWALAFILCGTVLITAYSRAGHLRVYAPAMRATIETVIGVLWAASMLTLVRLFRTTHELRDLFLFAGIMVLGLVEMASDVVPIDFDLQPGQWLTSGGPVAALFAAVSFGVALRAKHRYVVTSRPWGRLALAGAVAAALVAELLGWLAGASMGGHGMNEPGDPPALIGVIAFGALATAVVGYEFRRPAQRDPSGMQVWFGAGILLLATSLAVRLVEGPSPAGDVTPSVVLALGAYGALLAGLLCELRMHHRRTATTIARLERQRLARNLHDGLCQDLAVIAAHAARATDQLGDGNPLALAANRALRTARGELAELAPPSDSVGDALRVLAAELTVRFGIAVTVDLGFEIELDGDDRDDLVQIAREAIVNAVKHGGAHRVAVEISQVSGRPVMSVRDDGSGIGAPGVRHEGFGMGSMRQRAASLGAVVTAEARAAGGTEVKVSFG